MTQFIKATMNAEPDLYKKISAEEFQKLADDVANEQVKAHAEFETGDGKTIYSKSNVKPLGRRHRIAVELTDDTYWERELS